MRLITTVTAVCAVSCAACHGTFGLLEVSLPDDAAPMPDEPMLDAAPDAPGVLGFSPPTRIDILASTGIDGSPTMPSDMLEIFFKSNRIGGVGGFDIWRAARNDVSAPWSTPAVVPVLSTSSGAEGGCHIAPDGLTIWFHRGVSGSPDALMVSTRPSRVGAWATATQLTEFNTSMGDGQFGSSQPAQLVGYMVSRRGSSTTRIVRSKRASTADTWGTPETVLELQPTAGNSEHPWVTPDGLSIIFNSNRGPSEGSEDLWLATRASTTVPFDAPVNLSEINDEHAAVDPWISPDLRHIVFTYTGPGAVNYDIFEASR